MYTYIIDPQTNEIVPLLSDKAKLMLVDYVKLTQQQGGNLFDKSTLERENQQQQQKPQAGQNMQKIGEKAHEEESKNEAVKVEESIEETSEAIDNTKKESSTRELENVIIDGNILTPDEINEKLKNARNKPSQESIIELAKITASIDKKN